MAGETQAEGGFVEGDCKMQRDRSPKMLPMRDGRCACLVEDVAGGRWPASFVFLKASQLERRHEGLNASERETAVMV